jgi:hypothetical protein
VLVTDSDEIALMDVRNLQLASHLLVAGTD